MAAPVSKLSAVEGHSIDYVPESERHGKVWQQGPFWFLGNFQFFSIAIGFIGPSAGLSLGWSVLAGALGILFGGFFMAFHASQGPRMGLPQMIQSRAQFGYRGVLVPLAATLITFGGFNVIDQILIGSGLEQLFGWNHTVVAVGCAVAAAVLAIFGHDWLHRVFRLLFWVAVPCYLILSIGIVTGNAGGVAHEAGFSWAAFMAQFAAAAAYNISYSPYVSDYSRYLPRRTRTSRVVASVYLGACLSAIWLIALGAWLASRMQAVDALLALEQSGDAVFSGLGTVLAVLSVLALIATMGLNAYSGMLTVVTAVDCVRPIRPSRSMRALVVLGLGAVWVSVGLILSDQYLTALSDTLVIMLLLLVPWSAINLVDFFYVRRSEYAITHLFNPDGIYGAWAGRGLISYVAGLASMAPFAVFSFAKGPFAVAIGGVDISYIIGLAVSGGLYYLLTRSLDLNAERTAVEASERELTEGTAAPVTFAEEAV